MKLMMKSRSETHEYKLYLVLKLMSTSENTVLNPTSTRESSSETHENKRNLVLKLIRISETHFNSIVTTKRYVFLLMLIFVLTPVEVVYSPIFIFVVRIAIECCVYHCTAVPSTAFL